MPIEGQPTPPPAQAPAAGQAASEAAAARPGKGRILIVDDEPDVLESTALVVKTLGYEALTLSDPGQILDTVEQERPALLLQDLKMPGLNVSGLVAALRVNPETAETPIVFFSAGSDLAATAARYDAWGYLPKPFSPQEMAHLLRKALGPPPTRATPPRDLKREMRTVFHEYWNLLAALSNYIVVLDRASNLSPDEERSVRGLDELILKLESKTDRLRAYVMSLVGTVEQAMEPDVAGGA